MNQIVFTYLFYLAVSVGLTIWVARKLRRNGRVFLLDVFHGDESLADSVSHLLAVGFYLIILGYVSLTMKLGFGVADLQGSIEALSRKVGTVLLALGVAHFLNLYVLSRIRRRHVPADKRAALPEGSVTVREQNAAGPAPLRSIVREFDPGRVSDQFKVYERKTG
jgi:hypothetical protein